MATTPTVSKRQLGALIRYFRTNAEPSLTQQQLGVRVFPDLKPATAQNKIANIEGGERSPDVEELKLILDVLGVTDPGVRAWAHRAQRNTSQRGRWNGDRSFYDEEFRTQVDLEEDSERIRAVSVNIAPDLLNEESYLRDMWKPYVETMGQNWVDTAVRARLLRQHVLAPEHGKQFEFLLCESAARRRHGSITAHRRQIQAMLDWSTESNVAVRIIPFDQGSVVAASVVRRPFTTFHVPGENVVPALDFLNFGNNPADNRYYYEAPKVTHHNALFEKAWAATLDEDASRRFLAEILRETR